MKTFYVFASLCIAYAVNAGPISHGFEEILQKERQLYPRFLAMPIDSESVRQVDLEESVDHELVARLQRNPALNEYLLYTRFNHNVPQYLAINNIHTVLNSNFDPRRNTVVLVHGWSKNGAFAEPIPTLLAVFLAKEDVNVIVVDWSHLSSSNYITASSGAPEIGKHVGNFVNWLHESTGLPYEQVHLVGASLGAHIVGSAGRQTGSRVARISGLDPAGPLWNLNSDRLGPNDGVYVEAIHTDGGYTVGGFGIGSAIVQVDFFANGGVSQPGCLTNACNHDRAWELFAATVTYDHLEGRRCTSSLQMTLNTCRGDALRMGNSDMNKTGTPGSYRVNTGRRYPF